MIDIQMTGTFPEVNPHIGADTMPEIVDIMYRSVQQNFIEGGRPETWTPLQPFGEASHLYRNGNLFENIQLEYDDKHASVFIDTERVPYAAINNFGGVIKHPGSKKFQVFQVGGEIVFTHGTEPHDINIPQRMFMLLQEEDKEKILEILSSAIFIQSEEE